MAIIIDDCEDSTAWTQSAAVTIVPEHTNYVQGSGALNLNKDTADSGSIVINQTYSAQQNLTTGAIEFWLYIKNLSDFNDDNALELQYGNDTDNHYVWLIQKSTWVTGWQVQQLTPGVGSSETGTVVTTAMDFIKFTFEAEETATLWGKGSLLIDAINIGGITQLFPFVVGGIGTRTIATRVPVIKGLQARTETQQGRITNLVPKRSYLNSRETRGL